MRFVMMLLSLTILFSSAFFKEEISKAEKVDQGMATTQEDNRFDGSKERTLTKSFGSYKVDKGWIESKKYSQNEKYFYVKDGEEDLERPNNVAINVGTCKYSKEEKMEFSHAILNQLAMQGAGKGEIITSGGGPREDGVDIISFRIEETKEDYTTIQHYVVGDKKFALIHATIKGEDQECEDMAMDMANSFTFTNN